MDCNIGCFSAFKDSYIEQHWVDELNDFNQEYLNPFLN